MRNIDWSSYLCSSDLRIQVFLGRHHSHPAPARLHHLADLRSERLEQIRVGWDRLQRSIDPVNLLYPFEVDRIVVSVDSLLCLPVPRSRTCCTMARFENGLEIGRAQSELQSLMRISYAVFCLKNKKQQHS